MSGGSDMAQPLLSIRDLYIESVDDSGAVRTILKGVSLDLREGEVLGIVGESGAGKSMLGLASMGYARRGCRLARGQVLFRGLDLVTAPEATKQRLRGGTIAYVAQSAAATLNPAHKLIHQFTEVPVQHGVMSNDTAVRTAIDLYRQMRLPNPETIGYRYPHQLSGGQLQRAMTAMAMACPPNLIIFDEPTTALDVTTQVEVLAAIKSAIRAAHIAAIFISHDLAVVAQMADRVMVLRHGELVETATTANILSAPQQEYTKSLWSVRSLSKPERPDVEASRPILSVRNVSAGYRNAPVLADVSMVVPRGKTTAIVGESGSGKSTLARVVAGLLPPASGSLEFDGAVLPGDLRDRSADQRRRIQLISQSADTTMNPKHRIREILGRPLEFFFGRRGDEAERAVRALLRQVELPESYIDRYPSELSGGQKQRIGIARALAAEPDLVICDEITSGLDQLVAESILKLLLTMQESGNITYLFITHDLATVNSIADDVVIMLRGTVVDAGPKTRIMSPPFHPYTEALLSSVPQMDIGWLDRILQSRVPAARSSS